MNDIVTTKLSKSFGKKAVLKDFTATFKAGKVTNIMGSSGCGKTTLLNILMGLEKADSGRVSGVPNHISAVFQEYRLCEEFSAVSNILMVTGKRVKTSEIERHLRMLGLGDSLHEPVQGLSGGMKQRVVLVRAVLHNGDVLFLDEAFKGLDIDTKSKAIIYVREHAQGKTIINITHDLQETAQMGGKLIKMENQ